MILAFCGKDVSIHHILLFIEKTTISMVIILCCFNTSHVTLYQLIVWVIVLHRRFQYITCYSLSGGISSLRGTHLCFNTSHVTLYRRLLSYGGFRKGFNTSHVTLYRFYRVRKAVVKQSFNTSHVTLYRAEKLSFLKGED